MNEIRSELKKILNDIGIETEQLRADQDLFENGVDSLRLMELVASIEDQYDIEFPFDDLDNDSLSSIEKIEEVIKKLL